MLYNILNQFTKIMANKNEIRSYLRGVRICRCGDTVTIDASNGYMSIRLETTNSQAINDLNLFVDADIDIILDGVALVDVLRKNKNATPLLVVNGDFSEYNTAQIKHLLNRYPFIDRIYNNKYEPSNDFMNVDMLLLAKLCNAIGHINTNGVSTGEMLIDGDVYKPIRITKELPFGTIRGLLMPCRH